MQTPPSLWYVTPDALTGYPTTPRTSRREFADPVSPEDGMAGSDLPSGEYLLWRIKASGMAGEIVWEAELALQ